MTKVRVASMGFAGCLPVKHEPDLGWLRCCKVAALYAFRSCPGKINHSITIEKTMWIEEKKPHINQQRFEIFVHLLALHTYKF